MDKRAQRLIQILRNSGVNQDEQQLDGPVDNGSQQMPLPSDTINIPQQQAIPLQQVPDSNINGGDTQLQMKLKALQRLKGGM